MKTPYDAAVAEHTRRGCIDKNCEFKLDQQLRREGYRAALQSPEVQALRKALERLLACKWVAETNSTAVDQARTALAPWKGEADA